MSPLFFQEITSLSTFCYFRKRELLVGLEMNGKEGGKRSLALLFFCSEGRSADILQDVYYRFLSVDVDIDVNTNFYLSVLVSSISLHLFFFNAMTQKCRLRTPT